MSMQQDDALILTSETQSDCNEVSRQAAVGVYHSGPMNDGQ